MKTSRRSFLASAGIIAAAAASGNLSAAPTAAPTLPRKRLKLGVATYSYWHFRDPKMSIETVMDKAAEMGVEAVDILHRQMDMEEKAPLSAADRAYLRKLKRHAFRNGLDICCVSTHQTFVNPNPDVIAKNVAHTQKCIELADALGCPSIRINTGRWDTAKDFDAKNVTSLRFEFGSKDTGNKPGDTVFIKDLQWTTR